MSNRREMSESGMLVYPKLPLPKGRESEPRMPKKSGGGGGFGRVLLLLVLGLVGGAAAMFFLRPIVFENSQLADSENALAKQKLENAEAMQTISKLKEESKRLDEQRELLAKQVEATKQAQDMVADKQASSGKLKEELEAAKKRLDATGAGTVSIDGGDVRLVIADKNLFKAGDALSGGGNKVLDKVAAALKDLSTTQIAVHGHTDDTPPPKPAAPKKSKDKKAPPPPTPEPEFATNWELSAARALAVVHYFQDTHKIDASRLSVEAFSQYRPASKKDKAANRRVEIVVTPKPPKK